MTVSDKDAGILLSSLLQFMINQHNEIVRRVDEVMLLTKGEGHRGIQLQQMVPAMEASDIHMLKYDMQDKFLPFVEKHCVNFRIGGTLEYDFAAAEQYRRELVVVEARQCQLTCSSETADAMAAAA